jgi:hypothetical protein
MCSFCPWPVGVNSFRFNARLVVYILYSKLLGDNIYKQWELGGIMAIRIELETGVIGKGGQKKGEVSGEEIWGLLHFVTLMCFRVYFCCCSGGCMCQGLHGTGFVYSCYRRLVSGW